MCWLVEESRVTKGTRRRRRRTEGSSFSLLFPLIKISNMITADLATIIEQLEVEFAKPRFASASAVAATKPSVVLYLPFLFFPSPSIPLLAVSFSPFLSSLSLTLSLSLSLSRHLLLRAVHRLPGTRISRRKIPFADGTIN